MNKKKLIIIITSVVLLLAIIITAVALIVKNNAGSPDSDPQSTGHNLENDPSYIIYGEDNEVEDIWEADDWE